MRPLATIVLIFTAAMLLCAQEVRLRRVGVEHGLPQSYVNHICQDSVGFMWFGTQDGLARFDGRKIKNYRHRQGDVTSLTTNNVLRLIVANDSTLCASTGGGYCVYERDRDSWKAIDRADLPIAKDQNRQQIGTAGGVNVTYTDRRGRSWIGTASSGLCVMDPSHNEPVRFSTSEPGDRRIASNEIWALYEDRNGNMWVGMNGGGVAVIRDDRVRMILRHDPSNSSSLSNDLVRCFCEDNIGSMWIGTFGGGVCQYDPYANMMGLLRPSKVGLGFTDDFARGIAQGPDGSIYIGLRTGIIRCNRDLGEATLVAQWKREYTSTGAARALYVDRQDNLWIGSELRGVGVLRRGSKTIHWISGRIGNGRQQTTTVSSITEIAPDTIAIGTDGGIAFVATSTLVAKWIDVPRRSSITEQQISVSSIVRIANTNEYFIGTEFGLYRRSPAGAYTYVKCPDKSASWPSIDIIRSVVVANNRAIVGTWNGGVRIIDMLNGGERVIDQRVGLPSDMAYAAIPISDERLLISSNAGIVIWNHKANALVRVIGIAQGAQSHEFNSWSWLRAFDGSIYFGGVGGVNRVQSDQLQMPPAPSVVMNEIREVNENGEPLRPNEAGMIVLKHDANNIYVNVSAIALSASEPIEYRYKVSESSHAWAMDQTGDIQLSSLAPGQYTIVMQARYKNGEWGAPTSLRVDVASPPWQSWWFIVMLVAAASTIAWSIAVLVSKRRASAAYKMDRLLHDERMRIAKDLHDDIGTGLAKIVILSENSISDEGAAESARVVADTAREVIDSVRSIVWVMKSTDESLWSALAYASDTIADLFREKGIDYAYHQQLPEELNVDILKRRNIVLSVKECATNIVRHSKATTVRMTAALLGNEVVLELLDNGVGYDTVNNGNGSGIENIRTRMAEVGGIMSVETHPGKGTRITLSIPVTDIT